MNLVDNFIFCYMSFIYKYFCELFLIQFAINVIKNVSAFRGNKDGTTRYPFVF